MTHTKPTLATLNMRIGMILDKLSENDKVHDKIIATFANYEERFHKLFENGPISNIQKELVRMEDKINLVEEDLTRLRTTTKWIIGMLIGMFSPVAAWGVITAIQKLFHLS